MGQELLDEFRKMCENHDLTFEFSDDDGEYRRGFDQYRKIVQFAQSIPRDDAVRIWNEVASKKLRYPADFMWSV